MNRRIFDIEEMLRNEDRNNISCENCSENGELVVPQCINTEYCVGAPRNMNNGILTMAFIDMQPLENVYPVETSFCNGSLFPNIDKPFFGGKRR